MPPLVPTTPLTRRPQFKCALLARSGQVTCWGKTADGATGGPTGSDGYRGPTAIDLGDQRVAAIVAGGGVRA